jgi:hypothetical protein
MPAWRQAHECCGGAKFNQHAVNKKFLGLLSDCDLESNAVEPCHNGPCRSHAFTKLTINLLTDSWLHLP